MDKNHHFTGNEQAEYNALSAKGRTLYDTKRWYQGYTHEEAYQIAYVEHGLKSQELRDMEAQLNMIQDGVDPRITW